MNSVVVYFVPLGSAQPDFETALREYFPSRDPTESRAPADASEPGRPDADALPLWTWFLPNPCR